jgi:hypothetical protein
VLRLSKTTSKALLMLSLDLDVAPFTVVLTVFSILLHKFTREVRPRRHVASAGARSHRVAGGRRTSWSGRRAAASTR